MAIFAIGDIQGCYKEFKNLLNKINFNPKIDKLWLTGDLVNRGPNSYDVIKYIMELESSAITVLGNHDFYLLASYFKASPWPYSENKFYDILSSKDVDEIIMWLKNQKLVHIDEKHEYILVHAGIYPKWTFDEMLLLSAKIEESLKSKKCKEFLETLWTNNPNQWSNSLSEKEKLIFSVNVFTRMRYLNQDLSLNFDNKSNPDNSPILISERIMLTLFLFRNSIASSAEQASNVFIFCKLRVSTMASLSCTSSSTTNI